MDFIVPRHVPSFMDKIGLIDADYIKYHVLSRYKGEDSDIPVFVEEAIASLRDKFQSKALLFCFSGTNYHNFRNRIAFEKEYKGTRNRNTSEDGELANNVKEQALTYVMKRYSSLCFAELEADDLCCMLQDEDTFIYSEDKDLLQVPGTHWNIKKGEFIYISEDEALRNLMQQMILGDAVDNIQGLRGCGPVACEKILTNSDDDDIVDTVLSLYITQKGTINGIDAFVENWMLLKLRTNRGAYFIEKYKHAFQTLDLLRE